MDENIHSADEVEKRFERLPNEVKKLLYSEEMHAIIVRVGQKHQLHIDQMALLEAETGQVMLGFVETKDYPRQLTDALKVDMAKAEAIAQDMNVMLFLRIRDAMKGADAPTTPSPAQPTQTPVATSTPAAPKPPPAITSLAHKLPMTPAAATMPSVPAPVAPSMKPSTPPPPAASAPITPAIKPQVPLAPHPHDLTLQEKTITTPATPPKAAPAAPASSTPGPAAPQKPANYPADPYREPVEPQ